MNRTSESRIGRNVRILGGMSEFVGKTGVIIGTEDGMYRVRLHEVVDVAGVGKVHDDLWEGRLLRNVGAARPVSIW